jgi:hypothetical protein
MALGDAPVEGVAVEWAVRVGRAEALTLPAAPRAGVGVGKLGEIEGRGVLVDSSSGEGVEAAEGVGSEEPEPAAEEGVAARAPEAVARMVSVGELFAVGEDVKAADALPPPAATACSECR